MKRAPFVLFGLVVGAGGSAECLGPSACGCVDGTFCNFDDGDSGGCEGCLGSEDACRSDGLPGAGAADCVACCDFSSDGGGGGGVAPMDACLDVYASRLGVTAVPSTASDMYRAFFCQYASVTAPNGKAIEIFGGSDLSSLQLYRAKSILAFYLEDVDCDGCFGEDKAAVANAMANNGAKLDMPNGAHEAVGAGTSLEGQELYWAETPVEGDDWFLTCDYSHRDAAFEEILHLVHDSGIGVDRGRDFLRGRFRVRHSTFGVGSMSQITTSVRRPHVVQTVPKTSREESCPLEEAVSNV